MPKTPMPKLFFIIFSLGSLTTNCSKVEHVGKSGPAAAMVENQTMSDDVVSDPAASNAKEISQLKQKDGLLEKQIEEETKAREDADAEIRENIATLEKKVDDYKKEIDLKIADLNKEIEAVKYDVFTNYATKKELEAGLSELQADLMEELAKTQEQLMQFQEFAAQTYATKEELTEVKSDLNKLSQILSALSDKVTDIDSRENEHYESLIKLVIEVRVEIKQEITTLKIELTEAIKDGDTELKAELEAKIKDQESKLDDLEKKVTSEVSRLEKELERVEGIAINAQKLAEANKKAIETAVSRMENEFTRLNAEDASTKQAIEQLKLSLNDANLKIDTVTDLVNAFKAEFDQKLDGVRDNAMSAVAFLGEEVAKAFAQDNAALTEKLQQAQAIRENFFLELSKYIPDAKKYQSFREQFENRIPEILALLKSIKTEKEDAEQAVVDIVAREVLLGASAEIREHFDRYVKCSAGINVQTEIPTIQSLPYFMVLARALANDILLASRRHYPDRLTALEFLNHFHVFDDSNNEELFIDLGLLLQDTLVIGVTQSCEESINYWVEMVYNSESFISEFNQNAGSTDFKHHIIQMYMNAKELGSVTAELVQMCEDSLGSSCNALKPEIASYLGDLLSNNIAVMQLSGAIEDVYVVAKDVLGRISNSEQRITELENLYKSLNTKIEIIVNNVTQNTTNINNSFYLIQIIAERLGFTDVAEEAIDHMTGDPSIDLGPNASCLFTQHRYLHLTNGSLTTAECRSRPNPNNTLDTVSDCQIHALRGDKEKPDDLIPTNGVVGYTWGNIYDQEHNYTPCLNQNGWQCSGQLGAWADYLDGHGRGRHVITNGLKILALDPTDAKAQTLAQIAPGTALSAYPASVKGLGESTFVLDIFGNAQKFSIEVDSARKAGWKKYTVDVDVASLAPGLVQNVSNGINRYSIPLPKAIQKMANCQWERKITVHAFDMDGNEAPQQCHHQFTTFSPLVLKLRGHDMIQTVSPLRSKARFDIDANGIKDSTGWISSDSGFLAIDLNGNGKIDDGRELFGEASKLPNGHRAGNGYLALGVYDSKGKGYIDNTDSIYEKLMLWVDLNQNGSSEKGELFKLKSLGITRIDTGYTEVAKNLQTQTEGLEEGNLVKYQSRFYGPKHCGKEGCASFDVFFGKTENYVLSRQR